MNESAFFISFVIKEKITIKWFPFVLIYRKDYKIGKQSRILKTPISSGSSFANSSTSKQYALKLG